MNKSILRKIANELNIELNGNVKSFIFLITAKYLKVHNILNRENWLKDFIKIDKIDNICFNCNILDNYNEEFENIECIGWLYQYFISEEKMRVFDNLKNNIKVEKSDIHYATRTFYS